MSTTTTNANAPVAANDQQQQQAKASSSSTAGTGAAGRSGGGGLYADIPTRTEVAQICSAQIQAAMNDMPMQKMSDSIRDFAILATSLCDEEIETVDAEGGDGSVGMTARQALLLDALRDRRQLKILEAMAAAGIRLINTDRAERRDVARQLADAILEQAK